MRITPAINMRLQVGASLVEILVSMVIIAIGLLGLAALQNTSMRLSYDSYLRSQANFLAYDLIDRARANSPDVSYELAANATLTEANCLAGKTCSNEGIRDADLYHWLERAKELLPDATTEVDFDGANNIYTLRIIWDDRYENDAAAGDGTDSISASSENSVLEYHFKVTD